MPDMCAEIYHRNHNDMPNAMKFYAFCKNKCYNYNHLSTYTF